MYGAQGQVEMENWKLGEEVEKVDNWKLGPWVLRTDGQSVLRYTVSQYSGGRSAWLGTPSQPHVWVRELGQLLFFLLQRPPSRT